MFGIIFFFIGFINANAILDKGGHLMYVEYSISEPIKEQGVLYVDILFHYRGETYMVARHMYPEPVVSIVDTFPWVSKDRWEGGDLEVVARKADGSVERSYISEKSIEIKDLGYELPEFEWRVNSAFVKVERGPDPYAWRMLGYDPGHTGYYPFSLYPPLDSLWMYDWSGAGTWTTEISGCAGHDMLFIPLAPWGWNRIAAFDVSRGDTIWERVVTANVWTSALSLDDSTLFVGTSIGFTPWKDTTLYALDPFTGELKWGKSLKTVEYSPIVVDTFVYAPHFYRVYCFTYSGDSLWAANGAFSSPVYDNGIIVGASTDSVLTARNWLTGELLWNFAGNGDIQNLLGYNGKIVFSPFLDPLYAVDVNTGELFWTNFDYPTINSSPPNAGYQNVYFSYGYFVNDTTIYSELYSVNAQNGETIWDTLFLPLPATYGGTHTRIVISDDSLLWIAKNDAIYIVKSYAPKVIYFCQVPTSHALFSSWGFPIAYKNHFIYAHEDFLIVYKTDTTNHRDSIPSSNSTEVLYLPDGHIIFHLVLQKSSSFSLSLYTLNGRKVWELYEPLLPAGTYDLNLPELPHSGVYILQYSFSTIMGTKKIIFLKRR